MVESPSIETLREALAPVEALRGEQSQLESWIRESFAAIDALHGELSEWQRELTRQQALLDQREAAQQDADPARGSETAAALERQLAESQNEARQLEEENAEQLQAVEELERQVSVLKAELRLVTKHAEEQRKWTSEVRELRTLLELHVATLAPLTDGGSDDVACSVEPGEPPSEVEESPQPGEDVVGRAAEFRRRAQSRRAGQRRTS
jgi:DNA repair exonuclease SbcCD ATPase subunit